MKKKDIILARKRRGTAAHDWNWEQMGKQTNISTGLKPKAKGGGGCEDIILYLSAMTGNNTGQVQVVRYDPTTHQGIVMNGPTLNNSGDIAMWENKFYNVGGSIIGGIDEYEANYTTNTYSFVQNIPGGAGYSPSYNMRDAVTLVTHSYANEWIFIWDISSGIAVLSSSIHIGVAPFGDLINTSQGFMVSYTAGMSTNPPSIGDGIAHYDFTGNLIDFVTSSVRGGNLSSAGMYKIYSTGDIFFDTYSGFGGLYQLFYDGVPMSVGPLIHSPPYPPISANTWQGASSYCFEMPSPACMDPAALNYDPLATADCNGIITTTGTPDTSCCEYSCHKNIGTEPPDPQG